MCKLDFCRLSSEGIVCSCSLAPSWVSFLFTDLLPSAQCSLINQRVSQRSSWPSPHSSISIGIYYQPPRICSRIVFASHSLLTATSLCSEILSYRDSSAPLSRSSFCALNDYSRLIQSPCAINSQHQDLKTCAVLYPYDPVLNPKTSYERCLRCLGLHPNS